MKAVAMRFPLGRAAALGRAFAFPRVLPRLVAALAFAGLTAFAHGGERTESARAQAAIDESRRAAAAVWRLSPCCFSRYSVTDFPVYS